MAGEQVALVILSSLSLEQKLKRLLYIDSISPEYVVGDPDVYHTDPYGMQSATLDEALEDDLGQLFQLLDQAIRNSSLPRRSIMFTALAVLLNSPKTSAAQKSRLMSKVLGLRSNEQDFFGFIRQYTRRKSSCKLPTSVAKGVRRYYDAKSPQELAKAVAEGQRIKTWSHKDLIKLAHVKADTALKNVVFSYILNKKLPDGATEEELQVLDIIRQAERLRCSSDPAEAVLLLNGPGNFGLGHIRPSLHKSQEVWSALLPKLPIQDILARLVKLYKLGLLKPDSAISKQLIQLLTCEEKVRESAVHPLEVFIQMKRLERGGKPMDPKLLACLKVMHKLSDGMVRKLQARPEVKCPHIVSALWRCFEMACSNLKPTNKRYLVSIDVPPVDSQERCIGSKAVTFLEAAVAYAIALLRVEQQVTVTVLKEGFLETIRVKKRCAFHHLLEHVSANRSGCSILRDSVEWAESQQERIDVFLNFLWRVTGFCHDKYTSTLSSYREKMNLPNNKYIVFTPLERDFSWQDNPLPNVLAIKGFDPVACKVAECFSRDDFC